MSQLKVFNYSDPETNEKIKYIYRFQKLEKKDIFENFFEEEEIYCEETGKLIITYHHTISGEINGQSCYFYISFITINDEIYDIGREKPIIDNDMIIDVSTMEIIPHYDDQHKVYDFELYVH